MSRRLAVIGEGGEIIVGRWPQPPTVEAPIEQPFFVLGHPTRPIVYATSGGAGGSIHVFGVGLVGAPERLAVLGGLGEFPCHLALSPDLRSLTVVDYGADRVIVVPLSGGMPHGEPACLDLPDRHPHAAHYLSSNCLLIPALSDRFWLISLGRDGLTVKAEVAAQSGSGPRHVATETAGVLWCTGEFDSSLTRYVLTSNGLMKTARVRMAGNGSFASDVIVLSSRWVVAGNRGAGTLTVVDARRPDRIHAALRVGRWPAQFLGFGERSMFVCSRDDDAVHLVHLDANGIPAIADEFMSVRRPLAAAWVTDP